MQGRTLPRGPRTVMNSGQSSKPPIPPTIFRFQSLKKLQEQETAKKQMTNNKPPLPYANPRVSRPQMRPPPIPQPIYKPPPVNSQPVYKPPPVNSQPVYKAPPVPRLPPVAHLPPEPAPVEYVPLETHQPMAQYEMPCTSSAPMTNYVESNSVGSTNGAPSNTMQNGPVEHFDTNGSIEQVKTANVPTTIELPSNCKLFQYSWVINGIPRTLLVPMPINATEDDVKAMLPQTIDLDSEMFQSRPREELPVLAYPDGTTPNFEMAPEEPIVLDDEEEEDEDIEDEMRPDEQKPILVNPKQFTRIVRRREMRQRFEADGRLPMQRQKYLHESRHRHALNRKRGVDGRFDNVKMFDDEDDEDEEDEEDEDDDDLVSSSSRHMRRSNRRHYVPQQLAPIAAGPYPPNMQYRYHNNHMNHNGHMTMMNDPGPSMQSTSYGNHMMDPNQHHTLDYMDPQVSSFDDYHPTQYEYQSNHMDDDLQYQDMMVNGVDMSLDPNESFTAL